MGIYSQFGVIKFRSLLVVASMAMLIEYLMGLSDSIVAGNILGEPALAGLNLLQSPMNVVSFVACLIGTGTAICFSLETGRFDSKRAAEMFSQGFWSALAAGGLLVPVFAFGRDAFLGAFGAGDEVLSYAVPYWNWFVPNALFEPVAILLASAAYADGDSRLCFWAYLVQLVGNFGMSLVLCRAFGISGCAMGTLVGNLLAIAILSCHFLRRANTLRIVPHFSFGDLLRICRSSFGDASVRICWAVLFILLNMFVISNFGPETLPVLTVVITVLGFSEAFNGVANAAQPIVGVYVGEKNVTGVRTVMRAAEVVALVEGFAVTVVLVAFPRLVVDLVGISEPDVVSAACMAVRLVSLGIVFTAAVSLFNSYYLFIERETLACVLTVLANLAVPAVLCPLMGKAFGANGAWLALGLAPVATVAVFGGYLLAKYGRSMFPLLLVKGREANIHIYNLQLDDRQIAATSAAVAEELRKSHAPESTVLRASLMVEEVFMVVKDRNAGRVVHGEATLDLNDSQTTLVLRDDGEVFDITDADARITSLRTFLVASVMEAQPAKLNLTTTGYNRNVFKFDTGDKK